MKKIVFNGRSIVEPNPIGVGRYTYEILKEFDVICENLDVEVLIPCNCKIVPCFQNIQVVQYGGKKSVKLWEQIWFLIYIIKKKAIGINLSGNPPLLKPDITCKHDLTHLISPRIYIGSSKKRVKVWIWHKMVDFSLMHFAKMIITVSETSKRDIAKYYHFNPKNIYVIGNSWQHLYGISPDYDIFKKNPQICSGKYFFCLGAQNKNKNFDWIIKNAELYPQNQYVIAGKYVPSFGNQYDYKKMKNLIFLGYVSDAEMKALMSECLAFVFPSLYEGFGIPPMEALCVGKDAIVSKTSCLPEIYEDAVYYIDPCHPDTDLNMLLRSKKIDSSDKERVLNKYSWEKSAKKLKKVIEDYI